MTTELTLIAQPGPDGLRLKVRVADVSLDGSLWDLWPTLIDAIDGEALAAPHEVGTVSVADGTVQ